MSVTHANKTESAKEPQGVKTMGETAPQFADNRASTTAQLAMQQLMHNSPRSTAQRATANARNASPVQQQKTIQRAESEEELQLEAIPQTAQFADMAEEEPVQGKFETAQRAEDEELLQGKFENIQRVEDEEPLQGKFETAQRAEDEELLQGKFEPAQRAEKPNNTGLPDNLKSGIENLSGMSMDHVKVHYNSDKPAQLQAHAYAQGSEIHVAPGQEKHLPHEAWHVVQQAQGRVEPTVQKAGVKVNDDVGLEAEADVMGARAAVAHNKVFMAHEGLLHSNLHSTAYVQKIRQHATVFQLGRTYNLEGVDDETEGKAEKLNLEAELKFAVSKEVPLNLINNIFKYISNQKLPTILPHSGDIGIWGDFIAAMNSLGDETFQHWLSIVGFAVLEMPEFKMLLTDHSAQAADATASEILEEFDPPPSFAGMDYSDVISTLKKLGYTKMVDHMDTEGDKSAYGMDVWCNAGHMVVRIKVGGRGINGRFPRPPHLVKEITSTSYKFGTGDIICKLTDENLKIPAGTKYSAKDMQTWYVKHSAAKLDPNSWKAPNESGDGDFAALHHMWAEGAHTAIGRVPSIPLVPPSEVAKYEMIYEKYNNSIIVGRMEKYGIDASISEDDERDYLNHEEYLLWSDAKKKLGIKE